MKLSKLYCNQERLFGEITFSPGLNVVRAEIRMPQNKEKDTHNLGKSTLGAVIDYCLISQPKKTFFLFQHKDRFKDFVFYLELELLDGSFLTVRRGVSDPSKISFKRHAERAANWVDLPEAEWNHWMVPIDRAKALLDGLLDLRSLKPWRYRKVIGYLLRTQEDFREVFQLKKFASIHAHWKPFLAHLLGFDSSLVSALYLKEEQLSTKQIDEDVIQRELGGSIENLSKIEGLLLLKRAEVEKKQEVLHHFDFGAFDADTTKKVVDELDVAIGRLNSARYSLQQAKKRINDSLSDSRVVFDPDGAKSLFAEAGVFFAGQLKKDFDQLMAFNKAITEERRGYLKEELGELEGEINRVSSELTDANQKRTESLAFLKQASAFDKYRHYADELISLKADIESLERQQTHIKSLKELRAEIRSLETERTELQALVEIDVEAKNADRQSLFSTIRMEFSGIVEAVIDRKALLSVATNSHGHLEFGAELLDDAGNSTSADRGTSYKKLMCIAFDLALLRAHLSVPFPRFVFHDGVFESLDDRKKLNLLRVSRGFALIGIQHIITLIDSDAPPAIDGEDSAFFEEEVVLTLHDEGSQGRLFRMPSW